MTSKTGPESRGRSCPPFRRKNNTSPTINCSDVLVKRSVCVFIGGGAKRLDKGGPLPRCHLLKVVKREHSTSSSAQSCGGLPLRLQQHKAKLLRLDGVEAVVVEVVLQVTVALAEEQLIQKGAVVHEIQGVEDVKAELKEGRERLRNTSLDRPRRHTSTALLQNNSRLALQ